ncbi:type VII secretion system-associated protein [Streptomyces sp. LP11]|uniref:Type VII secretion system-associated protein n=1 Tax=Streptomyces pyxinicus TaxID=2970331 RepID=A0ABT2AU61_9ACTN|nr:type VII secretion system-associated protein [Streptomyces sp. LP11]MCS0599785.1 type VII secretion system-associated protein [Streptomyces sp. LP11]
MRPGESRQGGQDARSVAAPSISAPPRVPEAPEPVDTPEIPEAVRDAARRAPGHWIGVVDPEWDGRETPPEWAVVGEWQSDESGGVGDYRANPAYRPSARALGWPEPTDPVDAAAQRAATGYGPADAALAALAEAEVTVVRGPDGAPLIAAGREGAPVVLLFTAPAHAFLSETLHHDTLLARELARTLSGSGSLLMVNAGAVAPLLVPSDAVLEAPGTADAGTGDRTDSSPEPWPHTTGRNP